MDECKITGSPGITAFQEGQDVSFAPPGPSQKARVLSVNSLRPHGARLHKDIILHRTVLTCVGKPLWEYSTPTQFIQALLAIVQGEPLLRRLYLVLTPTTFTKGYGHWNNTEFFIMISVQPMFFLLLILGLDMKPF